MAAQRHIQTVSLILSVVVGVLLFLCSAPRMVNGWLAAWQQTTWTDSHATFYGGQDGSGTMGGACGYGNLWWRGYGLNTAALSETLFNGGLTCGACFELKCNFAADPRWCYNSWTTVTVTATNFCPANWAIPTNNGGWCNPPRTHFDLPEPLFTQFAFRVAGIVPIQYRRVACARHGGIRFTMGGNLWFNIILIHNVGGAGDINYVQIRGSAQQTWFSMGQNWGQNWDARMVLQGQSLSFRITLGDGKVLVLYNVTPQIWWFGQTFEASENFY